MEFQMFKHLLAAAMATALIAAPLAPALAQAKTEKSDKAEKKAAKKLTPQQQKMKDCAGKWKEEKAAKKVSGRAAYNKFMSGCLKGSA
jgi:Ni/Co efflux regulator RcnB